MPELGHWLGHLCFELLLKGIYASVFIAAKKCYSPSVLGIPRLWAFCFGFLCSCLLLNCAFGKLFRLAVEDFVQQKGDSKCSIHQSQRTIIFERSYLS